MSFYRRVIITFTDGSVERIGATHAEVNSTGTVLHVYTRNTGDPYLMNSRKFPLVNIRSWRWED